MRPLPRFLVVAPHPDDDAIGCGGTLARAAAGGVAVTAVYLTDGAASHPNSRRYPGPALRALREREAAEGLHRLGIATTPVFLRVPDGTVAGLSASERARVTALLGACIDRSGCDVVFAPWSGEPHPDHAGAAALVKTALEGRRAACLSYAVWLEISGTPSDRPPAGSPFVDVNLTEREVALKRAAIMAHASQVTGLIDDDPAGFRASPELLDRWLQPVERFYAGSEADLERVSGALDLGTVIR